MATLVRWSPFRELESVQREMSRLMNGLIDGEQEQGRAWVPAVDVWETENSLVYAFDLPGIPREKVNIEVEEGSLTVTAERERSEETSNERFYRFERRFGTFTRTIGLPQGVNEDQIRADFKDGVLEIHVPKPEQPKPRRIQIGGEDEQRTIEGTATKQEA